MLAKPVVPWIGGKRRLAKHILPLLPGHKAYVEPFAGAAAILFMKPPSDVEVINDINGELVNLYRVLKHHLEELLRQFKWALSSRQMWDWCKITPPETLTDVQRAARFFYLQKQAFGGKVDGQNFGYSATSPPRLNLLRIEEDLSAAHLRLSRCLVEHLPWAQCVAKYDRPETLFYCDPPYWQTEGYGVDFGIEHYEQMARMARTIQGKMVISINDHPDIRRVFKGLPIHPIRVNYTLAGGHKAANRGELIIRNSNHP